MELLVRERGLESWHWFPGALHKLGHVAFQELRVVAVAEKPSLVQIDDLAPLAKVLGLITVARQRI